MGVYVGWAPTIVGRVAFSRVGLNLRRHPDFCNLTIRSDGFLFGREIRTSPDGPLPAFLLRPFRVPDQHFALFLEVGSAALPRVPVPAGGDLEMIDDERGKLEGMLYFFSKSDLSKELGVDKILSRVGDQAAKARGPRTPDDQRRKAFEDAQSEIEKCFTALVAKTVAGEPTPAFARARVRLDRTGRCEIEISPGDLYINRLVKSAHRSGVGSALWQDPETIKKFDLGERFIARHVYNVVRGLSHKHYHHHEHADLLATTYPWSASDDQTWRRETLYGLARMAIEIRRRGTAKAFKQCAGVVAYAEAFQLHLGTWSLASDGSITSAKTVPPYDFGALRNSVDASLKVRELEDAERRQTIIYLTTIFLAALTLVVGGMRALETPPNGLFADFLTITTNRPFETIGLAILLGWLCDLAFLRAALPLPATRRYYYGLKRFVAAAMGSLIARKVSPLVSYMLALLFLALLFAGAAGLSLYSIGLLSRQLGALALGS